MTPFELAYFLINLELFFTDLTHSSSLVRVDNVLSVKLHVAMQTGSSPEYCKGG